MSAPAGWYDDGAGVPRWWDGYRWVEASAAYAAPGQPAPVPPGTSANTVWVWLMVLLPLVTLVPVFGYLAQLRHDLLALIALVPFDGSSPDMGRFVAAEMSLIFSPWYLVLMLVGWGAYAAWVWFAALDARELAARGFVKPFPWAWAFLSSLVYVIGRHVVVRQRGGRGAGPLITMVAIQVGAFILTMIWCFVLIGDLSTALVSAIPYR
ncbi:MULTISPECIES: DUF2510 domain-containing protein [unclassified Microbacterium]|uniref:DUF2510 domain-containing protein n=1 Tax=unclassified Microbacterium TaxID=2609290 RepID=UPI003018372E